MIRHLWETIRGILAVPLTPASTETRRLLQLHACGFSLYGQWQPAPREW